MNRGDVVLVRLPFVGSTGAKSRPALVVQDDTLNKAVRETIIAEITSNTTHAHLPHQVSIDVSTPEGAASGLLMDSAERCNRLHVVPQVDVQRTIGSLDPATMHQIDAALKSSLGVS